MTGLQDLVKKANKKYGEGTILSVLESKSVAKRDRLSSGIPTLDYVLGGGFAQGLVHEIAGEPSAGKSTLAYTAIANAQRQGMKVLFFDVENAASWDYMAACGMAADPDRLFFSTENRIQVVFDTVDAFARSGEIGLIVIDSLAQLVDPTEMSKGFEGMSRGGVARWVSQGMRLLIKPLNDTNTTLLVVNQVRVNQDATSPYMEQRITPGGKAWHHACATRTFLARTQWLTEGKQAVGLVVRAVVKKNKTYAPRGEAIYQATFLDGVDATLALVDLATQLGTIHKRGAWLVFNEHRWNGRVQARTALDGDDVLYQQVEQLVQARMGSDDAPVLPDLTDADEE